MFPYMMSTNHQKAIGHQFFIYSGYGLLDHRVSLHNVQNIGFYLLLVMLVKKWMILNSYIHNPGLLLLKCLGTEY